MEIEAMKNPTEEDTKRTTEKAKTFFAYLIAMQETLALCAVTEAAISICVDCGDIKGLQKRSANLLRLVDDLKTGCDELERLAADPDLKRLLDDVSVNTADMKAALFKAEKILKKANDNLDAAIAQYEERVSA